MKKLLMLSLMLLSFGIVFTSCSDDDDDSIEGTWKYTTGNTSVEIDASPAKFAEVLKEYDFDSLEDSEHTVVLKDGKVEFYYDGRLDVSGTYVYKGGVLTMIFQDDDDSESINAQVSVSNNEMIVKYDCTEEYGYLVDDIFHLYADELEGVNKEDAMINKILDIKKYTRQ